MKSREYYSQIETIVKNNPIIIHFSFDFDEIDLITGFLKGKLELIDGSILYFIEYFEIQENTANRLKYKYQWQSKKGNLICRWDNVPHYPDLDTFPHHMHDKNGVHASSDMDLKNIIDLIMNKIIP